MNIALIDLNHTTRGVHTNTVPLGLGLISRYLERSIDFHFEIKIYKTISKLLRDLKSWKPDVLGMAQYVWNSELNLSAARLAKSVNPDCVIIAGGPNLGQSAKEKNRFLNENHYIDFCVSYDGEIPFSEIVRCLVLEKQSIKTIRENPVAGTCCLHPETGRLVESDEEPPRLKSLDFFETIYADGKFDEFLDDGFHPFVQTHRGCPFTCAFCHTSDHYYSKMLFQSPHLFRKDLEYLGKRFAGKSHVTLYIANTNMGLFKEDFEIARIIRDIQGKYDWPQLINVNSGKDTKKLLEMLSIINFQPAIALQTLTPKVLKKIKRKNIPINEFVEFQKKVVNKTGGVSGTELILSLPGETKETFLSSLSVVLNSKIQNIVIYTLMNLKGTPIASEESRIKYGHRVMHRVVPRQFSEVNGEKIIETEEVIVGADSMPYEDYLELRGIGFVVKIFFSSAEMVPLKRFMSDLGIDLAQWVFQIHNELPQFSDLHEIYMAFIEETEEELFETRDSLIEYFGEKRNWELLCDGRLGENLLRKYMRIILYDNYDQYLELAFSEALKLIKKACSSDMFEQIKIMIDDVHTYISSRNVKQLFEKNKFINAEEIILNYDIPGWLKFDDEKATLMDFKGLYRYQVALSNESIEWKENYDKLNKDMTLSLDNLYHEEGIEKLWPAWVFDSSKMEKSNRAFIK